MQSKVHWSLTLTAALALAGGLSGCHKSATGQVAAVVNGDEVSLQEVNAETAGVQMAPSADKNELRAQALQRIVDRRLIAQQAKTAGLDRDPEYLLRKRQVDEALLLQFYTKKAQDTLRVPDAAAINQFIADHPTIFAGRTVYTVDQIRFLPPKDPTLVAALKGASSQDAVAALLKQRGIQFDRSTNKVDSAQVPPAVLAQVTALRPGEPFVVPGPAGVAVSVITGSQPAPMPDAQSRPVAVQAMRNQELGKVLDQRLKDARASAKIEYQSGFGPAKTTPASAPSPVIK